MLFGEVLRESLVGREKHRIVMSTPFEDVLVGSALKAQVTGVLCLVSFGYESGSECRWEVLVDEKLHAGWAVGR